MSLPKLLLFNHSCMYAKRGGVAAYHIVWIGLCLRCVPGVRKLRKFNIFHHSVTVVELLEEKSFSIPPRHHEVLMW